MLLCSLSSGCLFLAASVLICLAVASCLAEFAFVAISLPMELTGRLHLEVVINKDSGSKTVFHLWNTITLT